MKAQIMKILGLVLINRKPDVKPVEVPVRVHSTLYRLSVEGMEDLKEGWMCYCVDAGCIDLIQKVVTHRDMKEYLGADEDCFVPRLFHPGADNELEDCIPYFLWLDENKADLDSYCESIINEREGRKYDAPAIVYQRLNLSKKAA